MRGNKLLDPWVKRETGEHLCSSSFVLSLLENEGHQRVGWGLASRRRVLSLSFHFFLLEQK
jgi:hypothetical protein